MTTFINNTIIEYQKDTAPYQPTKEQRDRYKKQKKIFPYDTWLILKSICNTLFPAGNYELIREVKIYHHLPTVNINGRSFRTRGYYLIDFAIIIDGKKIIYIEHDDSTHRNYLAIKKYDKKFTSWTDADLKMYYEQVIQYKDNWVNEVLTQKPNTAIIRINDNKTKGNVQRRIESFIKNLIEYKTDLKIASDWDNVITNTSKRHIEWFGYDPYDPKCGVSLEQIAKDFKEISNSIRYYTGLEPHLVGDIHITYIVTSRLLTNDLYKICLIKDGLIPEGSGQNEVNKILRYISYDNKLNKFQILSRLKIDFFIDDDPSIVEECLKNGIPCFLANHEHNRWSSIPYRIYNLYQEQLTKLYNEYFFTSKDRVLKY